MSNLTNRLLKYQDKNGLTNEKVFLALRDAGVPVSGTTVNNWLSKKTSPSQMYKKELENFLHKGGV